MDFFFFFFTAIVCEPYLEQRPVELRRGPSGAGREASLKRLRNGGQWEFPWKLVARSTRNGTI